MEKVSDFTIKIQNQVFNCKKTECGNFVIYPFVENIQLDEIINAIQEQTSYFVETINPIIPRKCPNMKLLPNASKYYLVKLSLK